MAAPEIYMRLDLQLGYCSQKILACKGALGTRGRGCWGQTSPLLLFRRVGAPAGAKDSLGNKYVGNHRKARLV